MGKYWIDINRSELHIYFILMLKNTFSHRFLYCFAWALCMYNYVSIAQLPFMVGTNPNLSTYTKLIYANEYDTATLGTGWGASQCSMNSQASERGIKIAENAVVSEGFLKLFARSDNPSCINDQGIARRDRYSTSEVHSPDFLYGYFEIAAIPPEGDGIWPALWFWNGCNADGNYREIDIMEGCGCNCFAYHASVFYETDNDGVNSNGRKGDSKKIISRKAEKDCFKVPQIYGISWEKDWMRFYFNGEEVWKWKNKNFNMPMPLIMGVGLDGPNDCRDVTPILWNDDKCRIQSDRIFPESFDIEYVRIWKRPTTAIQFYAENSTKTNLSIGERCKLLSTFIPDATYSYSVDNETIMEFVPYPSWDCVPVGVWNEVDITPQKSGEVTVTLVVTFPSGYSETKRMAINVGQ
jgi:Glycosyl hydrolases family 16